MAPLEVDVAESSAAPPALGEAGRSMEGVMAAQLSVREAREQQQAEDHKQGDEYGGGPMAAVVPLESQVAAHVRRTQRRADLERQLGLPTAQSEQRELQPLEA